MSYALYENSPIGLQWTHENFQLLTQPIEHALCGDFSFNAKFMNVDLTTESLPLSYDTETRTFTMRSEDFNLIGKREFSIQAYLTEYPSMRTTEKAEKAYLTILNPCLAPTSVSASQQASLRIEYSYIGASPAVEFQINPFAVEPPICDLLYACETILTPGQSADICSISDGNSDASFDQVSGAYKFQTADKVKYPPGSYQLKITGSLVDKSDAIVIELFLIDPCPTIEMALTQSPFVDTSYVLRDAAVEQSWTGIGLVTTNIPAECGPVSLKFYSSDDP